MFSLVLSFCSAVDVEESVVFDDGNYLYTANQNFSVSEINIDYNTEIFFNGLDFCNFPSYQWLSTSRICELRPEGLEQNAQNGLLGYSHNFGLIGLIIAIIVIINIFFAIMKNGEIDLGLLLIGAFVIIIVIIIISISPQIISSIFS